MTYNIFNKNNKIKFYLLFYLLFLFFFSVSYLFIKHDVGNDSTISEWLINYSGGFTKRGLVGNISIFIANIFDLNLRDSILIIQILIVFIFYLSIFLYVRNYSLERFYILALFSPIFLLYPVAEIEVLARKEVFIFVLFILHCSIPVKQIYTYRISKITILPISILIWEPVIFFILFWIFIDLIINKINNKGKKIFIELICYLPTILISINFIFFPLTEYEHAKMANYLDKNFGELCYMSCALLGDKSTIIQQFQGNIPSYSIEVFVRYFLIILIGFGPLFFIFFNSNLIDKKILFFEKIKFLNLLGIILLLLSPVLLLFAMGYDWGRWVNISYVMTFILFIFLIKNNLINIDLTKLKKNKLNLVKKNFFITIFIIFCFTWNPKTVVTGDVASFPVYRIPYKLFKINFLN